MSGVNIKRIRLKNVGVFESLEVADMDKAGFVTVTGLNLDSPSVANNKNGVGKSLMFGAIPNLTFEADPLAMNKREKTNMLGKDSEIELEWQSPTGQLITVRQTAKKYHVMENGQDMKIDRLDVGRTWIERHFPISREEFYSYCYIQTQIQHPFQRATESDRLKYLTSLFNLDVYDRIRGEIKQRLDAAKDAEKEAKGLADLLDVTRRKQKSTKITKADRTLCKELKKKSHQLADLLNEMYEQMTGLEQQIKSAKRYSKITKAIKALGIESADPKKEIKQLRQMLDDIKQYARYKADYEEYVEDRKALKAKIGDVPEGDADKLTTELTKLKQRFTKLEDELENAIDHQDDYEDYIDMLEGAKIKVSKARTVDRTQEEIEESAAGCRAIVNTFEELSDCIEGKDCPTCGQNVNLKQMEKAAKRAAAQYKKDKEDLEILGLHAKLKDLENNKVERPENSPNKIKATLRKLDDQIGDISVALKDVKKYDALRAQLEGLKKPKEVKKPKGDKKVSIKRIELLEELVELNAALKSLDEPKDKAKALEKKLKKLTKQRKATQEECREVVGQHSDLDRRIQEHGHHATHLEEIEKKLEKLTPLIEKREMFEAMYKAYSPNGLKLQAAEKRIKQIEARLNEYAPLVFPESMLFKLFVTKQGIGATVTRVTSGQTTDIRILSGAETNCFRLLWAPAILPFVPASRRLNMMILDEPEDKCSPAVRDHIITNFIPVLRTIVPNIFWITPQTIEHYTEKQWTVVKKDGKSELQRQETYQ